MDMSVRLQMVKKKDGFTAMELFIALALLLIVLGLGFNLFFYTQKTFRDAEQRWIEQREAKKAADYISNVVKNSYNVDIIGDIDQTYSFEDEYSYIFLDTDGIIKYKNQSGDFVNITTTGITNSFGTVKDPDGKDMYNVLSFNISTTAGNYELNSSVYLPNIKAIMPLNSGTDSTETGTAIRFKNTDNISEQADIAVDVGTFCFIATASYGTPEQQSVSLLRRFRDQVLLTNPAGRSFVEFYYRKSPAIAKIIERSPVLKLIVRVLLLPFIGIAAISLNRYYAVFAFIYSAVIVFLLRYRDKQRRRLG